MLGLMSLNGQVMLEALKGALMFYCLEILKSNPGIAYFIISMLGGIVMLDLGYGFRTGLEA